MSPTAKWADYHAGHLAQIRAGEEHRAKVVGMKEEGMSNTEIGRLLGVTGGRVGQIIARHKRDIAFAEFCRKTGLSGRQAQHRFREQAP